MLTLANNIADHGGDEEAERQAAEAHQQHRATAKAVGQAADDGGAEEVGDAEGEGNDAEPHRLLGRRGGEAANQVRQHRDDQADRDHVDQHGQHDEGHRGFAAAGGDIHLLVIRCLQKTAPGVRAGRWGCKSDHSSR